MKREQYYSHPHIHGQYVYLWHYGGYMSYSDQHVDYLSSPALLSPYMEYEYEDKIEGYEDRYMNRYESTPTKERHPTTGTQIHSLSINPRTVVERVPITRRIQRVKDIKVKPLGKPLRPGDRVRTTDPSQLGNPSYIIDALYDTHIVLDGIHVPWSTSLRLARC